MFVSVRHLSAPRAVAARTHYAVIIPCDIINAAHWLRSHLLTHRHGSQSRATCFGACLDFYGAKCACVRRRDSHMHTHIVAEPTATGRRAWLCCSQIE